MMNNKLVKVLFDLQAVENAGRGISCVRTICTYLEMGNEQSAIAVASNEFDKIRNYPTIVNWMRDVGWGNIISGVKS